MLIFIVFLYFFVACALVWLLVFPSGRELVLALLARHGARVGQRLAHWRSARAADAGQLRQATRQFGARQLVFARRHAWMLGAAVLLVLIPTVIAISMSKPGMLPGYEAGTTMPDSQVAALLAGEQLVPPVALPPLAFSTQEVELVRPMLVDASRNWGLMNPEFMQRLLLAFKIMKERHGYDMALLEGYRSPARQTLLASMGSQVTNAGAFQSYHQFGLAADCAFVREGKLVISEKDPWAMRGYQHYGEVAESLGLTWGGRWTMMDFGHTELRLRGVLRK
jgi:peptidoglycan L-alanyl-D-glutamate endopeptidase CwlK